jgi:hypothetical protein
MMRGIVNAGLASFLAAALWPGTSAAAWTVNGIPITRAPGDQSRPALVSGAGSYAGGAGVIALWRDDRSRFYDSGLMRVTLTGALSRGWPVDGLVVTTDSGPCGEASLAADGGGGAFVAWWGTGVPGACGILMRHVSADGVVAPGSAAPFDSGAVSGPPFLALASTGDLIMAWGHLDTTDRYSARILCLTPAGDVAAGWPADGVPLDPGSRSEVPGAVVADASGGALVLGVGFAGDHVDLSLHHVTVAGATAAGFPDSGLMIVRGAGQSPNYTMVPDGAGGAIAGWWRNTGGAGSADIFAQRVTGDGVVAPGWPASGAVVCASAGNQLNPMMVPDGEGGAVLAWVDLADYDIFAQRVTAGGQPAAGWPANGVPVCTAPGIQTPDAMASDGAGGAIVAWTDGRAGNLEPRDIYAQRLTDAGAVAPGWPAQGLAVCSDPADQGQPAIVADGSGGAIIAWTDSRNILDSGLDIYAAGVSASGTLLSAQSADLVLEPPYPNPAPHGATLAFDLTRASTVDVDLYDVSGRRVRSLVSAETWSAGRTTRSWDGLDEQGREVRPGIYVLRVRAGGREIERKLVVAR